jgi:hypothetical protein
MLLGRNLIFKRLEAPENNVFRKIFSSQRDEVYAQFRVLHNLLRSSKIFIINAMNSGRLKRTGHIPTEGKTRYPGGTSVGRRPFGRPSQWLEDNIVTNERLA